MSVHRLHHDYCGQIEKDLSTGYCYLANFIDDFGADSLDTVELVMTFEEEFRCQITDGDAAKILTVGDAVKFLEKNANT